MNFKIFKLFKNDAEIHLFLQETIKKVKSLSFAIEVAKRKKSGWNWGGARDLELHVYSI